MDRPTSPFRLTNSGGAFQPAPPSAYPNPVGIDRGNWRPMMDQNTAAIRSQEIALPPADRGIKPFKFGV